MKAASRICPISEVAHVRRFIAYAKLIVNNKAYFPPFEGYRYIAALALYSKCITASEAILVLLDAGFDGEAFGMTRTLVDIFITLRYIANKDVDDRAKSYCEFFAKDHEEWRKVVPTYWPTLSQPLDPNVLKLAANYRSPHKWSGKSAKDMALEPDTVETDPATGKPLEHDFAYRVIYRWTSHYVHPTIIALGNHLVQAGRDNFIVNGRRRDNKHHMAAFNVASFLVNTMVCFYRCMGDPQPKRLGDWSMALMAHLARRPH